MAPHPDKPNVVIKLKHGNTLRRIVGPFADHNMSKLRAKIIRLFDFKPNTDFYLTYSKRDGKVLVLEKDTHLHNAVICQRLNPLRINVMLRSATVGTSITINGQLQENDMSTFREKIVNLCSMNRDTDFFLTYTDEDGDVVTLEDNEELRDVVAQHLHPLKINVMFRDGAKSTAWSSTAKSKSRSGHLTNALPAYTNCVDCPRKKDKGKAVAASGSTSYQHPELNVQNFDTTLQPSMFRGTKEVTSMGPISLGSGSYGQFPRNIPSPVDQLHRSFAGGSSSYGPGSFAGNFPSRQGARDSFPFNYAHMSFVPHPMSRSYNGNPPRIPNAAVASCYTCGMFPTTGPTFKKVNGYPLCSSCIPGAGNDSHNLSSSVVTVAAADQTVVAPSAVFFKMLRMKNNGTAFWPPGTRLVFVDGYKLAYRHPGELLSVPFGLPVGHEIGLTVEFVTPAKPGEYTSYWKLETPTGQQFGELVRIFIHVKCSKESTSSIAAQIVCQQNMLRERFCQTGSVDNTPSSSAPSVGNARSSAPSVDDAHSSVPSVDDALSTHDAPPSVPMVDDSVPSVLSVDDAPLAVPSVADAPPSVSFADGGNEMEVSDNDWDSLNDELEEMGFPDTELKTGEA